MSDNDGMLPEDARVSEQDVDESAIEREFRDEYGELEQMFDKAEGAMASVSLLRIALRNEKAAPELLEYQQEVVEEVKHALAKQEEVIATIRGSARGRALQHMVLQMDFDRVRYLLLEYLRVRLRKIQSVGLYLITTQELHSRMSQAELSFCRAFVDLDAEHMQRLFLDRVPKSFRKYTEKEMVTRPNLDSFVFCRVKRDIGTVQVDLDGDDTADFMKDDLVAVRYEPIRELLRNGDVELV